MYSKSCYMKADRLHASIPRRGNKTFRKQKVIEAEGERKLQEWSIGQTTERKRLVRDRDAE